jgi:hypothetical protein
MDDCMTREHRCRASAVFAISGKGERIVGVLESPVPPSRIVADSGAKTTLQMAKGINDTELDERITGVFAEGKRT